MAGWIAVPQSTHQAAIAGKVIDARTLRSLPGVHVAIIAMPPVLVQRLALQALQYGHTWERLEERADRTRTAADGCFRFADLPDGAYTLSFTLPGNAHRYGSLQRVFTVTRDAQGLIATAVAEIPLPPTGVLGQIKGLVQGSATALSLARVRVGDSGESAYSDAQGHFYLTGVETGQRPLRISAAGFTPATTTALITEGSLTEVDPIVLQPSGA